MKTIKDPVHGYVEVPSELVPLLDSGPVQRLRHVRQLGFSYLVYPGAHHTRFEHSLGTMHLAGVMARNLSLHDQERLLVTAAGLLHDIGHGPFSHAIEPLVIEFIGENHQDLGTQICRGEVGAILEKMGIDRQEIESLIQGIHPLSGIIHGELDVDRMDYLLRDAHYTGAPYGTVDAHRLIRNTSIVDGRLVLEESGINAAESLLIARTLMRPAVYFHHVSRIAEMMFQAAVMHHVGMSGKGTLESFLRMDDSACIQALLNSDDPVARDLSQRIYQRRLYKRALYVGRDQVNASRMTQFSTSVKRREIASTIAGEAGLDPAQVLLDIPPFPGDMSLHVQVQNRHSVIGLAALSPLLNTLNETRRGQWRLGVYTLPEHRERVGALAAEVLHVKPETTQGRLFG
ncbi:MAG: deoxyguanosinetriphosphate triphosphohydrolase-like protein [Methanoregulaceae archaeon PtaU1.Bin222]|nr:MAG: deoxyguanosinetriphosphate triphosphohydrolase-like protein [Methanoregulaceae archaeon PtaU1.Bin222]